MTSSSDGETGSDDDEDEADTVILGSHGGSGVLYRSGAFSVGAEDKPINSDEWIYFLMTTMKVSASCFFLKFVQVNM